MRRKSHIHTFSTSHTWMRNVRTLLNPRPASPLRIGAFFNGQNQFLWSSVVCVFLEVLLNVQGSVRRCFPAEKVRKALCDIKNVFFQKGLHFKLWIDAVRSQKSPRFGGGKRMCSRHVEMRGRHGYWERRFPVLHLFIWKKSQKMLTTDYEFLFNPMQSKSGYCMFWSIS